MSTDKTSTEKKPFCTDRFKPCLFRGSNRCINCGRHRAPAFAVGNDGLLKSAALMVRI